MGARAVIVEDHDALSRGLELVLGRAGFEVVGSARTEDEGYELILRERPGLAVIDIGLEQGSGVALARRLAKTEPELGLLIYTGLEDEALLRDALILARAASPSRRDPLATSWRRPARSRPGAATSILTSPRCWATGAAAMSPCSRRANGR